MVRVLTYSVLLIVGMLLSQLPAIDHFKPEISALTMIFLAYIMIQVGMEFEIDKSNLRKYGVDYLVAMAAAAVPWLTSRRPTRRPPASAPSRRTTSLTVCASCATTPGHGRPSRTLSG